MKTIFTVINCGSSASLFVNMKMNQFVFIGRPKGADSVGHAACVGVFGLAGGAAEVDQPAARVQRAPDGLHPGPGVTGAGSGRGRPALQLRF